jgi:hypothetical protein
LSHVTIHSRLASLDYLTVELIDHALP